MTTAELLQQLQRLDRAQLLRAIEMVLAQRDHSIQKATVQLALNQAPEAPADVVAQTILGIASDGNEQIAGIFGLAAASPESVIPEGL